MTDMREMDSNSTKGGAGFTLLELALAVAILTLLIVVAVASVYEHQSRKAKKLAVHRLQEVAEWLHMQHTATRAGYAALLPADWSSTSSGMAYRISLARQPLMASDPKIQFPAAGEDTFTLVAEPVSSDKCGALLLDQGGRRGVTGPQASLEDCWP